MHSEQKKNITKHKLLQILKKYENCKLFKIKCKPTETGDYNSEIKNYQHKAELNLGGNPI
jgi:hypothetical protein